MKSILTVSLLAALTFSAPAQTTVQQLWPHFVPDPQPTKGPEHGMSGGRLDPVITDISSPTITMFPPDPAVARTNAAVLVFPGGGYQFLAIKKVGTEPCAYFASLGITCFLVKYRVPLTGHYPEQKAMIEDGQQAMRLVRSQAKTYGLDPEKIGVLGGSAGANLATLLSTHYDDDRVLATPAAKDVPRTTTGEPVIALPSFAILCWPAYLYNATDKWSLDPVYAPKRFTPPTFLIQAEDDKSFGTNAMTYYAALMRVGIPAELHMYATGGHGFGLHPDGFSQAHWTDLLTNWLRYNHIVP